MSTFPRWSPPCLLLVALLAGCTEEAAPPAPRQSGPTAVRDSWWIYRGNAALQGIAEGRIGSRPEPAWTFATKDAVLSSPVVSEGRVFIGSTDGSLYAVELSSGRELWSFPTEDAIEAPPIVHGGRVFVGSSDGFFYAVDAARGTLAWKYETGDKILGGANVVSGPGGRPCVVVGSYDASLYCFDAKKGTRLWTYETGNYVNGTPTVSGDRIVFGGCDAILHVVSARTGKAIDKVELGPECHVAASAAMDGSRVFLGHYGNEFICADLRRQEFVWSYPNERQPFFSAPALTRDRVLFGGRDKRLHCVSRGDGKPLWTFPTRRKVDGSPVVCGDKVVFGSGDGRLYLLALGDGKELWSHDLGRPIYSSPAVVPPMILVGCNDKHLYAFRAPPD